MKAVAIALLALASLSAQAPSAPQRVRLRSAATLATPQAQPITYPVVYVAAPRAGDTVLSPFADVTQPYFLTPNSDLRVHYPDGRDDLLIDAGQAEAIADPSVTLDGQAVLYTRCHDVTRYRSDVQNLPTQGCDLERVDVATKAVTVLTHQEREPNTNPSLPSPNGGASFPVYNGGPWELSDGRIIYTSNARNFYPTKGFGSIDSHLYVMNADGSDAHDVMPMSLAGVMHPFQLTDGRIVFSTQESQGFRDSRLWGLWTAFPDGRNWGPLVSAFSEDTAFHFATETSAHHLVFEAYYNLNNAGFGMFMGLPLNTPAPQFHSAAIADNPVLPFTTACGRPLGQNYAFTWRGQYSATPWTSNHDEASPLKDPSLCAGLSYGPVTAERVGKVTHPSAAPNGGVLLAYSAGPVNPGQPRPTKTPQPQAGIYLSATAVTTSPDQLVKIVDDPNVNEIWPRALVPYAAIYGVDRPAVVPFEPNDGSVHASLPAGTAYGLIGTGTVFSRESFPGNIGDAPRNSAGSGATYQGLDAFWHAKSSSTNLWLQGGDTRLFQNSDIAAVRIVMMEPRATVSPSGWSTAVSERVRVLGEVPINSDGSFLARIPADTPVSFQMLDKDGMVLTHAETWHQVRPGELKADCGGCHAHSSTPVSFATSQAATRPPTDLTLQPAHDVEYTRDVDPIIQRSCLSCHQGAIETAPARLAFAADPAVNYKRLANDTAATIGLPLPGGQPDYGWPQASRYVRVLNSGRSLLSWVLANRRLDGWTNATWPGPSGSQDATFNRLMSDVDFVGQVDHSRFVSDAERRLIATWIDTGIPLNAGHLFDDENRPALAVQAVKATLIVGAADAYSGIDASSLAVTVNGASAAMTSLGDGRWSTALPAGASRVSATVKDKAGNTAARSLTVVSTPDPPPQTLPAPVNVRFEQGAVISSNGTRAGFPMVLYPRVLWDVVPGAVAYEVTFTWSSGRVIATMPVMGANGFPLPLGQPGHQYRVSVKACDVLPPSVCTGTASPVMVVER